MIKGSCCCGAIQIELAAPPSMLGKCHCTRCRKLGVGDLVFVKKADLTLLQGREAITVFEPTEAYTYRRCFCKICGTGLGEILSDDESFPISAHVLDDEITLPVKFLEFTSEKPEWSAIGDDAPQFTHHLG
ncbi:GFA family protein [uncultured Pelagimonas sp.]|uniref:GFA family protein n=1 Tax=uncultured Pelagimonas sp. TaxID=1618102 RepID=UPI00260869EE|nr:GFA family protein [uncultured Pelagimonas sp.]